MSEEWLSVEVETVLSLEKIIIDSDDCLMYYRVRTELSEGYTSLWIPEWWPRFLRPEKRVIDEVQGGKD